MDNRSILNAAMRFIDTCKNVKEKPYCRRRLVTDDLSKFVEDLVIVIENHGGKLREYGDVSNLSRTVSAYLPLLFTEYHAEKFDFIQIYENGIFLLEIDCGPVSCGKTIYIDIGHIMKKELERKVKKELERKVQGYGNIAMLIILVVFICLLIFFLLK